MDSDSLINRICRLETLNEQLMRERDGLVEEVKHLRSINNSENLQLQIELLKKENSELKNKSNNSSSNSSPVDGFSIFLQPGSDINRNGQSDRMVYDENTVRYDAVQDYLYRSLRSSLEKQINELTISITQETTTQPFGKFNRNSLRPKLQELLMEKKTKLQILESFVKKNRKRSFSTRSSNDSSSVTPDTKEQKKESGSISEKDGECQVNKKIPIINGIVNSLKMANIRYESVDVKNEELLCLLNEEEIVFEKWPERIQVELSNLVRY